MRIPINGGGFCNYGVKILLPRDKLQKWTFLELKTEACGVLTGEVKLVTKKE
jgi:hypothetical protein